MSIDPTLRAHTDRLAPELIRIRRALHESPELAFEEHETAALVARTLEATGIAVTHHVGRTGVIGIIEGSRSGPTIGVRADMDCLPIEETTGLPFASKHVGRMHACGHDLHTAIGLGVAMNLQAIRERLPGRVVLLFQPAEETLEGARAMIADGALDAPRLDSVLGFHNWPALEAGKVGGTRGMVMASSDLFEVTFNGLAGHAAHPHTAIDVVTGAASFITQLQTIVSREIAPIRPAVVSIGQITAGTAPNILPGSLTLRGTVRTLDPEARTQVETSLRRLLEGVKVGLRLDSDLRYERKVPVLRNDDRVLDRVMTSARTVLDEGHVDAGFEAFMGSEDFACFAERVPSAYIWIGSKADDRTRHLHHSGFRPSEDAITTGVMVMSQAVLDLLSNP